MCIVGKSPQDFQAGGFESSMSCSGSAGNIVSYRINPGQRGEKFCSGCKLIFLIKTMFYITAVCCNQTPLLHTWSLIKLLVFSTKLNLDLHILFVYSKPNNLIIDLLKRSTVKIAIENVAVRVRDASGGDTVACNVGVSTSPPCRLSDRASLDWIVPPNLMVPLCRCHLITYSWMIISCL